MISFVQLLLAIFLAFFAGKLISKVKLPSILGWLIAGMILGSHGISLMDQRYWMQAGTRPSCIFWNVQWV